MSASDHDGNVVDEVDDDLGNRADDGLLSHSVLDYLARELVDDPDAVEIDHELRRRGGTILRLTVAPDDMGRVIGRRGRTAQAIRTVVRVAAAKAGEDVIVDIAD